MGFAKPKKPKKPKAPKAAEAAAAVAEAQPDPVVLREAVENTERARERRRQGTAAATLTGPRGLAGQPINTATKRLLGG